jgi:hypothetical protein
MTHFPCYPEWAGSSSRLDSKLFSILIASAFGAAPHNPGKLTFNTTSNFTRPTQ